MIESNRYFKDSNEEGILGRGYCYYEFAPFDGVFVATRQVETDGTTFLTSNLPKQFLGLCDQPLSSLDSEFLSFEIAKQEFEDIWNRVLSITTELWNQCKLNHLIGDTLNSKALMFYPQGTLVDIGESFFGLLDNLKYRERVGELRLQIQTRILGFDEMNRWVILELI